MSPSPSLFRQVGPSEQTNDMIICSAARLPDIRHRRRGVGLALFYYRILGKEVCIDINKSKLGYFLGLGLPLGVIIMIIHQQRERS